MFKVTWVKRFTSGNLKGLTFASELSFNTLQDAASYVDFLRDHTAKPVPTRMGSPYTCHNARIEGLQN